MSIPDIIEANNISTGNSEPHGIIYKIREKVTNNNILDYVTPSTNAERSGVPISIMVKWDGGYQSEYNTNAYVQVEFKDRYIYPTHYALKGYSYGYAKEWYIYGFNTNDDLTLLATHSSIGSTYCGDPSGCGKCCCNNFWGTFQLDTVNKAFRYIRLKLKTPSDPNNYRIALSGFEVFGILSKDARTKFGIKKSICLVSCKANRHLPTYMFLRFFSTYLS